MNHSNHNNNTNRLYPHKNHLHSFIICNIYIDYPKRRIFDIFQQKKICIIESIEFVLGEDQYCDAIVYVAKWYYGKLCSEFIEKLKDKNYVELIDCNHHTWKIVSTPTIIKDRPKWFQSKRTVNIHNDNNDLVVIKIKSKPNMDDNNYKNSEGYESDDTCFDSESEDFEVLFDK